MAVLSGADVRVVVAAPQVDAETTQTAVGPAGRAWYVVTAPRRRASTLDEISLNGPGVSINGNPGASVPAKKCRVSADAPSARAGLRGGRGVRKARPAAAHGTHNKPSQIRAVPEPSPTRRVRVQRSAEMKS